MKFIKAAVYPVLFTLTKENTYFVQIPDFDVMTQGVNFADAIEMARDAIKLNILDLEEAGEAVPAPGSAKVEAAEGAILSYVDINMNGYREKYGSKAVKKNCTIPQWLCVMAEENQVNFSKVLQDALIVKLEI